MRLQAAWIGTIRKRPEVAGRLIGAGFWLGCAVGEQGHTALKEDACC